MSMISLTKFNFMLEIIKVIVYYVNRKHKGGNDMKNELTAKRLKMALDDTGISQQDLADKSGVAKASISQYVNGSHAPSNISSGKIAKILGVNPLWLMGFDVEMRKEISSESAQEDMIFLEKFSLLNERDKKIILDTIDSMLSKRGDGAI